MPDKDARLFARMALDFADHPKIAILSDGAFRCLVEAILHSRERESDGLLARRYAVARWSLEVLHELCTNDDEKPSLIEVEKGFVIHDFADMQETKAEIDARRERNRSAGQKGGLAKAKRTAKRPAKRPASKPLSENVAEIETEIDISNGYVGKSATEPDARDNRGAAATPGAELVNELIPRDHPDAVRTVLRVRASELIHQGTPRPDVAAALELWLTKPSLGPNALPSLVSEAVKRRTAGNGSGKPHKLRAMANLAREVRATENAALKEIR